MPHDSRQAAVRQRESRECPFLGARCIKTEYRGSGDPIGTCTVSHQGLPHIICPNRFYEDDKGVIYQVSRLVLGDEHNIVLIPEVRLSSYGRVDFVAVQTDGQRRVLNFLPVEIHSNQTTQTGALSEAVREYERYGSFSTSRINYGMNTYMVIKTFFIQCLTKGKLFAHWGTPYVWVMQDTLFFNWVGRYDLELEEGLGGEDFIFAPCHLAFDDSDGQYHLELTRVVSASHEQLLSAFALPEESAFSREKFRRQLQEKLRQGKVA